MQISKKSNWPQVPSDEPDPPQGPILHGLGTTDLVDTDSPVSDADLRWALGAILQIEARGPSMAADLRAALADGTKAQWWRERHMTAADIEQVYDLADKLVFAFGVGPARAQEIAKEKVVGTRRTAIIATIREYLAMVDDEAAQQRQRRERLSSAPASPIVITTPASVPEAVRLAQSRRAAH